MDDQLAGYVELLRGVHGSEHVQTGPAATAEQLAAVERDLGVTLPADYKDVATALGPVRAGEPPSLEIYGEAELRRAPRIAGLVPLARLAVAGTPARVIAVAPDGAVRAVMGDEQSAVASFRAALQEMLQAAVEARVEAAIAAAPGDVFDDTPGRGRATLQMHAVPPAVVAVLKKETAVADEITLYTSVAEFREQTVHWEKTLRETDPPAMKEMVRRMRSLLKQPGIAKLGQLVGDSVDLIHWADAIVLCFGERATESLALRGSTTLPSDGTDTLHMLWISEVKQVAAVLGESEQRLRAGYQPDVLRARGLYNTDAPNEAAFLEELCALWAVVEAAVRDAASRGWGWLIRRTDG